MSIALLLVLLIYIFTKYKSQGQCGIYLGCSRFKNNKLLKTGKKKAPTKSTKSIYTHTKKEQHERKLKNKNTYGQDLGNSVTAPNCVPSEVRQSHSEVGTQDRQK